MTKLPEGIKDLRKILAPVKCYYLGKEQKQEYDTTKIYSALITKIYKLLYSKKATDASTGRHGITQHVYDKFFEAFQLWRAKTIKRQENLKRQFSERIKLSPTPLLSH